MNDIIELRNGIETAFIDAYYQSNLAYKPQFVSNNYREGKKVLASIEDELLSCDEFFISVAFITDSGIKPLLQTFKTLEELGVPGRILTTDYLGFSDPDAVRKLAERENLEVRFYVTDGSSTGFHTKGYIFRKGSIYKAIVGSSNLTLGALTRNKEWNTKLVSNEKGEFTSDIISEFNELWYSDRTKAFDEEVYKEYKLRFDIAKEQKRIAKASVVPSLEAYRLEPNTMQVKFIQNLRKLRDEGAERALLISATGTGKTYASAFALRDFRARRVLFIVHREQIAKQAKKSFEKVFGATASMGLLSGNSRDVNSDFIFATMQMMSKPEIMELFSPDAFDAIVIDEAHRSGAESYQRIMDYFKPEFWLGMTASPERTDDFDVYAAFYNNIAYEIRLQQAMEEDLLCPFHYFGIVDFQVNGETIGDKAEFNRLTDSRRVDYILKQIEYYGYSGNRVKGLIFCSNRDEAHRLSDMFNERGYKTAALTGDDSVELREKTIERLVGDSEDYLDYILTVDIFNEGVDIPEINQVVMLRPTKSPIVFVQQLGRGLRKYGDKEYVVVLDFIGNYENNYMIPIALSGDRTYNKDNIRRFVREGCRILAGSSTVHFDRITKARIFESIDNFRSIKRIIKESYVNLKHKLGRIPLMLDFFENGEIDPRIILENYKGYYNFLKLVEKDLDSDENFSGELSYVEIAAIEYLSKIIARGKRPHEAEVLKAVLEHGHLTTREAAGFISDKYSIDVGEEDIMSVVRNLGGYFVAKDEDRKAFSPLDLIEEDFAGQISITQTLLTRLEKPAFRALLYDIIDTALAFSEESYRNVKMEEPFILYEKYSRRDVCQLLNCEKDLSSIMYGMKVIDNDACIFVTYNKEEAEDGKNYVDGKPDYADEFIDRQTFAWDSKIGQGIGSKYVKSIEASENIRLFVKKSDGEGVDFYYMGKANISEMNESTKINNRGKTEPITKMKLKLKTEVREDLYDYLHN